MFLQSMLVLSVHSCELGEKRNMWMEVIKVSPSFTSKVIVVARKIPRVCLS